MNTGFLRDKATVLRGMLKGHMQHSINFSFILSMISLAFTYRKEKLTTSKHIFSFNMFKKLILALYNFAKAEIPTVLTTFNHADYKPKI
jgi:hypothetical protein